MILWLPEHIAKQIHNQINGDQIDVTDQIELEPYIDKENGEQKNKFHFKFGDFESHATLLDLPCVIESHKTLDDINFFKSQNISQMIYVHPNGE